MSLSAWASAARASSWSLCSICGMSAFSRLTSKATTLTPASSAGLRHVLQQFRQAVIDDDALHAEIDRLLHLVAFFRRVLAAGEDPEVDAERLGLRLGAGLIGLEEIARRNVADQRDLDAALVEWRRRTGDALGEGSADAERRDRPGRPSPMAPRQQIVLHETSPEIAASRSNPAAIYRGSVDRGTVCIAAGVERPTPRRTLSRRWQPAGTTDFLFT